MPYLGPRNALADAKDTLSSWDKCMAKTYCKWPVIVAIIVGSLIVLSVVFCVARCLCCGAECACCCFRCCAGCCGGGRKSKAQPPPPMPPPVYPAPSSYTPSEPARSYETRPFNNQQYRSHAAPAFNPEPDVPQYARFESNKPVNEDALPSMPTWGEATSTHVEEVVVPEKKGDVEMERLNHNGSVNGGQMSGVTGVPGPRRSPVRSPVSREDSYGYSDPYQNDSYAAGALPRRSPGPRASPGPPPNNYGHYAQHDNGYRGMSPVHAQSRSPVYSNGGMSPVHEQPRSPVYNNGSGAAPIGAAYSQSPPPNAYHRSSDQLLNSYSYDLPDDNPYDNQPTAYGHAYTTPSPGPAPMGTAAELPVTHTMSRPPRQANDSPYRVPSPPSNVVEMPYHENAARPMPPSLTVGPPAASSSQYSPLSPDRANTTSPSYPGQQQYQAFQPGR